VPPVADTVCEYGEPTAPDASERVVICIAAFTVMLRVLFAVAEVESVTVTTILGYVPAVVGLPLMTPVVALRVSPGGKLLVDDQV
jgi:hypothetical protein